MAREYITLVLFYFEAGFMIPSGHATAGGGWLRSRAPVFSRFQLLLSRTRFTEADITTYQTHLAGVTRRLETSFKANRRVPIGSAARGSAIRQSSDLDLMMVLKKTEAQCAGGLVSSTTILNKVADALRIRFWNTDVGRDGQAVVVEFRDGMYPVDVVPAVFDRIQNKAPIYLIPDGYGDWIDTSPLAHDRLISQADATGSGKLKNVAKLVKYWRWCRTPELPLTSFHVEMLLATERICSGVKTYSQCLTDFFRVLAKRECRALRDPLGISRSIPAANTDAKRERLNGAVQAAALHSEKAIISELDGQGMDAVYQWGIVFNGGFPA